MKVSCILCHWSGIQLILAYSWARPHILVAGKGRGRMFLFLLFLHFHSCSSLSSLLLSLLSLFSLSLGDDTKWPTRVDGSLNLNTMNQSISPFASKPDGMINPQWLKLPMSRTNFYGPKDVPAIEVHCTLVSCLIMMVTIGYGACSSQNLYYVKITPWPPLLPPFLFNF